MQTCTICMHTHLPTTNCLIHYVIEEYDGYTKNRIDCKLSRDKINVNDQVYIIVLHIIVLLWNIHKKIYTCV